MRPAREYRNIVFDMGHVLSEYDSRRAIARFTDDEAVIKEIRYVLYCSCEWQMLDAGLIDEDTALRYTLRRLSSDAVREIARKSFEHWEDYNLWPKPGMEEVVKAVKARGQNVYVLSNAGMRLTQCWRRVLPCPDLYDGVVFSAPERCVKPQEWIYRLFFERYGLDPADCLFIDDLPWNVQGAVDCGMDAWQFASGDVAELRRVLELD